MTQELNPETALSIQAIKEGFMKECRSCGTPLSEFYKSPEILNSLGYCFLADMLFIFPGYLSGPGENEKYDIMTSYFFSNALKENIVIEKVRLDTLLAIICSPSSVENSDVKECLKIMDEKYRKYIKIIKKEKVLPINYEALPSSLEEKVKEIMQNIHVLPLINSMTHENPRKIKDFIFQHIITCDNKNLLEAIKSDLTREATYTFLQDKNNKPLSFIKPTPDMWYQEAEELYQTIKQKEMLELSVEKSPADIKNKTLKI